MVAAGCFDPSYEEGIECSELRACPPGMVCDPLDNRCRYQPLPDPRCDDGERNGDETGDDCGGSCPACPAGQPCAQAGDCDSGVCDDSVCAAAVCGDGVINQAGEVCDDGGESAVCNADCTPFSCGDGVVNAAAGEDCDDGGESAACNANCTIAQCGDSTHNMSAGEACDDGGESALCDSDCTPVACGDGYANLAAGEQCDDSGDSVSCDADCTLAICGDGYANMIAGEDCDDGGDSALCDGDCTAVECGDGYVNVVAGEQCDDGSGGSATCNPDCTLVVVCGNGVVDPGEDCDLGANNNDYGRCGSRCFWGAGLDGSFGATWEPLAPASTLYALDSFHYSGTQYIHDFYQAQRYDPSVNMWSPVPVASPFGNKLWADAAVAPDSLWVPRDGVMYRYDLNSASWAIAATGVPDGSTQLSAAVFDGDGYIWYHGPGNDLVRYDPGTGTALSITHSTASGTMYETRVAYDPVTNSVVFTGYLNGVFTIFDIDTGTFSLSSPHPNGYVRDNTCQDRSGNIYTGSGNGSEIYRYNVAADTWTVLGPLPFNHDNGSTCVVSQDGYLYYASSSNFARLPLGVH